MKRDWHDPLLTGILDQIVERHGLTEHQDLVRLLGEEKFADVVGRAVAQASKDMAPTIHDSLRESALEMRENRRAAQAEFEEMLNGVWGEGLNSLEAFIEATRDSGVMFHDRVGGQATTQGDVVYDVLLRFHARGCRMAEECLVLLRSGFAQAAMARWRSLHELTVCGMFIHRHEEVAATPYLEHEAEVQLATMREHDELAAAGRIPSEPYSAEERGRVEAEVAELRERYGKSFSKPYGWALPALRTVDERAHPNFAAIEKSVELDHLRPWYRLANHAVHGGPLGITWMPDLHPLQGKQTLLAGPGFDGLADPIQCVALSLTNATTSLLSLSPSLTDLVAIRTLQEMSDEVVAIAARCSEQLSGLRVTEIDDLDHYVEGVRSDDPGPSGSPTLT